MTLTQKESGLLKDMKSQEELCIQKYNKCAEIAATPELKQLFLSMAKVEEHHLQTIQSMMNGTIPQMPMNLENSNNQHCVAQQYANETDRKNDSFLCQDMLTTEKHVSSLYNTSVFEFKDPAARKVLAHIQAEEQQHGEKLYAYMNANGMYS